MNYSRVIDEIFSQFDGPRFSVRLWEGLERHYGSGISTAFTLVIKDALTAQRLLGQGSLGFGESYMEGHLRIEGDLEAYLRLRHQFKKVRRSLRLVLATFLARRNLSRNRKEDIAHHYDLAENKVSAQGNKVSGTFSSKSSSDTSCKLLPNRSFGTENETLST